MAASTALDQASGFNTTLNRSDRLETEQVLTAEAGKDALKNTEWLAKSMWITIHSLYAVSQD